MADGFLDRVTAAVGAHGPLCAGIDPSATLLADWGLTDDASGTARVLSRLRRGVRRRASPWSSRRWPSSNGTARRVWPSSSGSIAEAQSAGLVVIADAKRGDIDSTADAYAEAWLSESSPLAADAVTAHPYLGLGALAPLVRLAGETGRGVLVVARSSNPEGRSLQLATTAEGSAVEDMLLGEIAALNASEEVPTGTVGAVIGATLSPSNYPLSQLGGVILAPGLGAQGAGPADVATRFAGCAPGTVLPSSSRGLLRHGPDPAAMRREAVSLSRELSVAMA